ncbi:MAG TPA: SpoIIE family protein phosphatase [Candidatus Polarisedimenticolia bacterium]|nr:SpoIIE family protein phosphatase [Candidatus Polarisedimenticolia bacterium]
MAISGQPDFQAELRDRRARIETALESAPEAAHLRQLLEEVDAALVRIDGGSYGKCESCHDAIEEDRLMVDPLIRTCLDHLNTAERRALERDLDLAARVQNGLLPKQDLRLGGWEAAYHYEPASQVSGDYCDLVASDGDGGDLFFLIGDVSGKGVAASMLMTGLRAIVRTLVGTGLPVSGLMERANRLFCESLPSAHFATLVCGRADRSGRVEICNAGHPPPLLVRRGRVLAIEATGLPLGLFCSGGYPVATHHLEPDDALLLYTDGLSEARNRAQAEYGAERLARLAAERHALAPKALLHACLDDLAAFRAGSPKGDDLTLMAIRRARRE